jgi:ferredoxin--NADP+ reductase
VLRVPARNPPGSGARFPSPSLSPVAILGDERVEGVEIVHNRLVADESGRVSAEPTGEHETIPCGIVFRSVGYLAVALPGVPFDERRATIPNDCGRVTDTPRVYCAGWIKRGPSGVIGTNKKDATETVDLLLEDARAGKLARGDAAATAETVERLLAERGVEHVTYGLGGGPRGGARPEAFAQPAPVKLLTWDGAPLRRPLGRCE